MTRTSQTLPLTAAAMIAFAANSVLCRMALTDPLIDPASFTAIRLASGAVTLGILIGANQSAGLIGAARAGTWTMALSLFAYAAGFSFAYQYLPASVGALILFGAVQCTMIGVGLARGERLSARQGLGALIAIGGLVFLLLPGLHAPDPMGAALMAGAGVAWGLYSLLGRSADSRRHDPTLVTAGNFLRAAPVGLVLMLLAPHLDVSAHGAALAMASGALASGLGYAIWYAALKHLGASEAGIVQLTVPVIAALGGVVFLQEPLTLRFALAAAAILGGVALVLKRSAPSP